MDPASTQKMSKASQMPRDHFEEAEAPVMQAFPAFIHPLQNFHLMAFELMNASMIDAGSRAVESSSAATAKQGLAIYLDFIGHLHPQQQPAGKPPLSIGPFEQLQASISPEAINWSFFEQIALKAGQPQDSAGLPDKSVQLLDFWHRMFPSAATAQEGALNGQSGATGIDGNALPNRLLQMLKMAGAVWGAHPDGGSSPDAKTAAGPQQNHLNLNTALPDRSATPILPTQTGVSEHPQMASAGLNDRISSWATGNSNSEILLETGKAAAEQPAHPNTATEGVTVKTPEEVFGIKDAVQKAEMPALDTSGTRISQIDADSKDSGLLFSQDQAPQHSARLENGTQPSEAAPRSLMPQALDQIVQRAVLSLHNGQHEVQLHLKPDFLGHIQMQIVSEGQQVAIKMVAELPFVKEMLENNLHQLKADLQAQGLDIDELEVSVAHDSHAERDVHQNARAAGSQSVKNSTDSDDGSSEEPGQTQTGDSGLMAQTAIDYFA
ncbi:MAG: flagellar hook-length control protein FliK [Deltaproteobacteria bacterium]|nr:flagellar hook-length control protein FliK [Deltaproteobacteria bacterium]